MSAAKQVLGDTILPPVRNAKTLSRVLNEYVGNPSHDAAVMLSGRVVDQPIIWPWGARSVTAEYRRALAGVGFTGYLQHGCVLAVCNAGAKAQLDGCLTKGMRWCPSSVGAWEPGVVGAQRRPEEFVLLRPGETVQFDDPRREGIYVALCCTETQVALPAPDAVSMYVRLPDPYIRLYPPGARVPDHVGWHKVPYYNYHETVETDDPASTTLTLSQGVQIPDGTTHVCLNFWDNTAWATSDQHEKVVAGESGAYEVWFLLAGLALATGWVHHEDDDFDVAGRGNVTPTHATEMYEIPEGATHVYVRQVSGDDFYYSVHAMQIGRR